MNPDMFWIRVDGQIRFENVWMRMFLNPERKSCGFKNNRIRLIYLALGIE